MSVAWNVCDSEHAKAQLVVVGFIGAIHRFRWFQPGCVWGHLALTSAALRFCDSDTCPVCEIKIYLGLCYWRSARLWGVNVLVTLYFSVNCHGGHKFINLNKFHAWESLLFFFFWIFSFFEGGGGGVWTLCHHLFNDLFVLMTACSELKRFSISSCCMLYVVWWRRTTHDSRWWTEGILLRGIHFLVSPAGGSVTWNLQSADK